MDFLNREVIVSTGNHTSGQKFIGHIVNFDDEFVVVKLGKNCTAIARDAIYTISDIPDAPDHDVPGRGDLTPEGDVPTGGKAQPQKRKGDCDI